MSSQPPTVPSRGQGQHLVALPLYWYTRAAKGESTADLIQLVRKIRKSNDHGQIP